MPNSTRQLGALATVLFAAATILSAQSSVRPESTPTLLTQGERLFSIHCGGCHGPQGQGGLGPGLTGAMLRRGRDPDRLFVTISDGIPGTEMPRHRQLHTQEIWSVVAFVETLAMIESGPISGDPTHGRDIYFGKGNCVQCHWRDGSGGRLGPDLTGIGSIRGVASLRESLVAPSAKLPPGFVIVSAVRQDGTSVRGLRVNEDPFTIQVRDGSQNLHSLLKADLQSLEKTTGQSTMPAYGGVLSSNDLDDLVAFLATPNDSENK